MFIFQHKAWCAKHTQHTTRTQRLNRSAALSVLAALCISLVTPAAHASRVKDITNVQGIRNNQLQAIGLVTGLAGDGDGGFDLTSEAMSNLVETYGIEIDADDADSNNVAIVMVNATIGPFAKPGDAIDVTVSSMGDADSLQGGVLLQTPLYGADGQVYAVAMGAIAVGGFIGGEGGPGGATVQKNHPTVGIISGGALVERPINTSIINKGAIDFKLINPDFTTAVRMADAINERFPASSQAIDPATVNVFVPAEFKGQTPNFIAAVSNIEVVPDVPARIVINERTGTIVATSNVRVSEVAISYGALTIRVSNNQNVSQPGAFGEGETVVTPATETDVVEQQGRFAMVPNYPSIEELTDALNKLGVTTRDMIAILQTLKESGSLQAELRIN